MQPSAQNPKEKEKHDQLMKDLNAAGGEKIIAELQRQLDEWLANNPDWNQ